MSKIISEETRKKMSESQKLRGDIRTPEHKRKMYEANAARTSEQKVLARLKRDRTLIIRSIKANATAELYSQLDEVEQRMFELEDQIFSG
jgi:hypothetical protein